MLVGKSAADEAGRGESKLIRWKWKTGQNVTVEQQWLQSLLTPLGWGQ